MEPIPVGNDRVILVPKYFINLSELEDKLKSFSYRVRKEDCLDLPEKIYQQRYVEFTTEQSKVYKQMREQAFAIIQNKEVSFANKLTEILKLHQVCNGFLKTNEGEIVVLKDCPKLKELLKVIEEGDGKFIIWANYIYNIESIVSLLSKTYGEKSIVSIYGAVSVDDRTKAVTKFQTDPEVRFFVGNPTTGGYGLTLTEASNVIYFSNSYNLEVRQQSEDRAHRIGQKKHVTYVDILMRNSIDILIVSALQRKIKISAETLGEVVKKWLT
jgi:SNF2 family DNA or RNA helicase